MDPAVSLLTSEQKARFSRQPDHIPNFSIIFHGKHEIPQYLLNAPCRFWLNSQSENYPSHWHSSTELIMPIENKYTLHTSDSTFELYPGDILLMPSGILHSITAPSYGSRFIFQFETDPLTKIHGFSDTQTIFITPHLISEKNMPDFYLYARNTVLDLAEYYWSDSPSKELHIYAALLHFFANYKEYYHQKHEKKEGEETFSSNPLHKYAITYALTYIAEHYAEALSLEHVASLTGFSKFHFSRLFKNYTGQTFYHYLYQYRLRIAQNLLTTPPTNFRLLKFRCEPVLTAVLLLLVHSNNILRILRHSIANYFNIDN